MDKRARCASWYANGQYMRTQWSRTTISKSLNLAATIATTLSFVARARVELANLGYEPNMIPFHHLAINVQLLTGVIQNQYWRHLDPAAQMAARAESFLSPGCTSL